MGRARKGRKQEATSHCWESQWEMSLVSCPGPQACWWSGLGDRPPRPCLSSRQVPTPPAEGSQPSFPAAAGRGHGWWGMGGDQAHRHTQGPVESAHLCPECLPGPSPPLGTPKHTQMHMRTCTQEHTSIHGHTCTRTRMGTHSHAQTCTHTAHQHTHLMCAHPHSTATCPDS